MYSPQKLHPISYILSIIDAIKNNLIFIIIFVFFQWDSFDFSKPSNYITPAILLALFIVSFVSRTIEIYRTRYWIENDYFIVTSGLFNLERKELNIRRIQSMDTLQPIIHQLVGGVKLVIKTPSDGIDLNMVTKKQSQWIQQEIESAKEKIIAAQDNPEVESTQIASDTTSAESVSKVQNPEVIYEMTFKNLLLMAMTSGALFVTLATILPLIASFSEWIPWERMYHQVEEWIINVTVYVIGLIILLLILAYVVGIIITMFKYYRFTLTRKGDFLKVRYGLFKVTDLTIPIRQLQAVEEQKSFIRHLFGYTSYHFLITSDMEVSMDDDFVDGEIEIIPFIKQREGEEMIKELVPVNTFPTIQTGVPWRGFHRRFRWISCILLIVTAVVHYYLSAWAWVPTLLIIGYMIVHSVIATRMSGSAFTNDEASIRRLTLFGFKTSTFKKDKILGFQQRAHPFMRRKNLAHFSFTLAKGMVYENIGIRFEDQSKVLQNKKWYVGEAYSNEKDE